MRKSRCQMISFHGSLFIVGGYGPSPRKPQPSAYYSGVWPASGYVSTDEHHMYALLAGELINCACMHVSDDEECWHDDVV